MIVVNGQRELDLAERTQPIENSLRVAAESMRYCIVDSAQLFHAMRDQMEGKGDAKAFCRRLIETEGVFQPQPGEAPGESEEETNDD